MRTVGVLGADLQEHRPRGRARNRVHEPLAHALDLGDDAVVAQRAVGLRVVGAPDDGEARVPAWGERWLRCALGRYLVSKVRESSTTFKRVHFGALECGGCVHRLAPSRGVWCNMI